MESFGRKRKLLHYKVYDGKKKDWAVLIHGFAGDVSTWKKQVGAFMEHYNLLLVDLPWHGKSEMDENFSTEELNNAICEILEKEHISKAHFVGFSLGSLVTALFTLQYPKYVEKMVLEASIFQTKRWHHLLMSVLCKLRYILPYRLVCRCGIPMIVKDSFGSEKCASLCSSFKMMKRKHLIEWVDYLSAVLKGKKIVELLNLTKKKILFVSGERDAWFFEGSRKCAEKINNSEFFVLKKCSHLCHLDDSEHFNRRVLTFFEESSEEIRHNECISA